MQELNITVCDTTADILRTSAEQTGATVGEIVDMVTQQLVPENLDSAVIIGLTEVLITMSRLDEKDALKFAGVLCGALFRGFSPEELEVIFPEIRKIQETEANNVEKLTDDEKTEFIKSLQKAMAFQSEPDTAPLESERDIGEKH